MILVVLGIFLCTCYHLFVSVIIARLINFCVQKQHFSVFPNCTSVL
nr:MAG TPA: hypothetical protein [Inoviridae sp.]